MNHSVKRKKSNKITKIILVLIVAIMVLLGIKFINDEVNKKPIKKTPNGSDKDDNVIIDVPDGDDNNNNSNTLISNETAERLAKALTEALKANKRNQYDETSVLIAFNNVKTKADYNKIKTFFGSPEYTYYLPHNLNGITQYHLIKKGNQNLTYWLKNRCDIDSYKFSKIKSLL